MNINENIGQHTFEIRMTSMGSIDPWFMDILHRYHIAAIGTSDVRDYLKYDEKIYCILRFDYELHERINMWKSMYSENKEDVEKDIQQWIDDHCDTEFGGYTIDDIFKQWDIEIVKQFEYIRTNPEIYEVGEKTFKNACTIFGEMVNENCYIPINSLDVSAHKEYMMINVPIHNNGVATASVEVCEDKFAYTILYESGAHIYSGLKSVGKKNIDELTNKIKKPRNNGGSEEN